MPTNTLKAEIIAIGTELLLGDIVNTNATWISQQLAEIGMDVYFHNVVGDNPERIKGLLAQAIERSNVLIFTGGLGPTEDDLTIATLADFFETELVMDPESENIIQNYFIARGMPMSKSNIKQALKPQGAETLANPVGTAPGILWNVSYKTGKPTYLMTFPGVPRELYAMWPTGKAYLQQKTAQLGQQPTLLVTRFLHFFGIGESALGELLRDLMAQPAPTVAPYVGRAEVKIRIAAKAATLEEANAQIEPVKAEILNRAGQYYFGEGETCSLEQAVAQLLIEQGKTIAVAESCTGGLLSSRLTDISGSSAYTLLNMVTYSNVHKVQCLGVSAESLEKEGAVSEAVAAQMAVGVQTLAGSTIGISTTGIAGPTGGTEDKPVGMVYIALSGLSLQPMVKLVKVNPKYNREEIKYWFCQYALYYLYMYLQGRLSPTD